MPRRQDTRKPNRVVGIAVASSKPAPSQIRMPWPRTTTQRQRHHSANDANAAVAIVRKDGREIDRATGRGKCESPTNEKNAGSSEKRSAVGDKPSANRRIPPSHRSRARLPVAGNRSPKMRNPAANRQWLRNKRARRRRRNQATPRIPLQLRNSNAANPTKSPTNSAAQTAKMDKPSDAKSQAKNSAEPPEHAPQPAAVSRCRRTAIRPQSNRRRWSKRTPRKTQIQAPQTTLRP